MGDINKGVRFIDHSQFPCNKGPIKEKEEEFEASTFISEKRSQPFE